MSVNPTEPESFTHNELLSQPETWLQTLRNRELGWLLDSIHQKTQSKTEWLFVGCGSSLYLATAAASSWTLQTGLRARAVAASEVLLFPDTVFLKAENVQVVAVSRSGSTSETVRAVKLLSGEYQIPILGLTCTTPSPLTEASDLTIGLSEANEESMVMTRSFTSLLLAMQLLAARRADDSELPIRLEGMAVHFAPMISPLAERMRSFVNAHNFADYVCFGQGPFYGMASEGALKVTEMSRSYSQVFHTLEFRHGPKTIVGPETCLTFFLSESGLEAESEVLAEMKSLGATTIAICNRASDLVRRSTDFLFELASNLPELALLAPFLVPAQLLGLFTSFKKGINPDSPRNLNRVVLLD